MDKIPKIYSASFFAFFLPLFFYILLNIWFKGILSFIHGDLVHSLFVIVLSFFAFYASFRAFKIKESTYSGPAFILSIASFAFAFSLFLHSISTTNISSSTESIFIIMDNYSLFIMSIILFLLVIPWEILSKISFRLKYILFLVVTVCIIMFFLALFAFPSFTDNLSITVPYILSSSGFIFFFTAIILMFKYRLNPTPLLFFTTLGIFILSNFGIISVFHSSVDISFWFSHLISILVFVVFLFGINRVSRKEIYEKLSVYVPFQNRLGTWLITFIFATSVIPLILVQYIIFSQNKSDMQANFVSSLYMLINSKKDHIITFLESLQQNVIDYSSDDLIISYSENIISSAEPSDDDVKQLNDYLKFNKLSISTKLVGINIFDLNGKIIASTDIGEISKIEAEDLYFRDVNLLSNKESVISEIKKEKHFDSSSNLIVVSAPLFSYTSGNRLGVIANYYSSSDLQTILDSSFDTGSFSLTPNTLLKSAEDLNKNISVYLVNSDKFMISDSAIYGSEAILRQTVNTEPSINCDENKNSAGLWRDYRGTNVYGASVCIEKMDWTLIIEANESYINEGLFVLRDIMFLVAFLTIIPILFFAFYFSRKIINPLENLTIAAKKINAGNFSIRANVSSNSEIKILSDAFNKMTDGLVDVNVKLKEKTDELFNSLSRSDEQNNDLVNTKRAILNILDDLNQEKSIIENEKSRAHAILASIGDAVFVVDKSSKITLTNDVALTLSGYTKSNVIGVHYNKIFKFTNEKNPDLAYPKFIETVIKTGKAISTLNTISLITKSGKKLPISYSAAPLIDENNNVIGCVVVFADFSRERDLERTKDEFLSVAAHQLRTPLSSMRWNMEMLLSGDMGELSGEISDTIQQIYEGNQRMILLVNDLLNISRIDQGRVKTNPQLSNIVPLIQSILEEFSPDIRQKALTISLNIDEEANPIPKIVIDPSHVHEVFENLLSNAIKYSRFGGEISVNIIYLDPFIQISISDNGIGIPSEEQSSIFSKFFRAENVTRTDIQGSGLGLFVVKSFVEAWGGTVRFSSKKDKGTTFIVTIPIKPNLTTLGRNLESNT